MIMHNPTTSSADLSVYDGRSIMLNILSFILPPLGLILYLLLMIAKLPRKAASAGRSATIGVIAYVVAFAVISLGLFAYEKLYMPQIAEDDDVSTTAMSRPPVATNRLGS